MNEYQFNVAFRGTHLFRTDWYDLDFANRMRRHLAEKFRAPEYQITQSERSKIVKQEEVSNGG